ncbi:MAG: GNAT family N-acetyltransferase [Sphingomonadaceae bacterium]|nr:GNAT family N-acetyltransferase [Sphingomonadaceae bacterium]
MPGAAKPFDVALFDGIDAAIVDAGDALERSAQPRLYDRADWLRLTARHVLPDAKPVIARARTADGAAWLFLDDRGNSAEAFARWYTLAFRPVVTGAAGDDARIALARALRGRFARLELKPMLAADADTTQTAFRAAGWIATRSETSGNWIADTDGLDFTRYWQSRPGKLRSTLARRRARAPLDLAICDRFEPEAWDAYEAVYAASWKPDEGAPAFLRALAEQEGAAGTLRLGIGRYEGRPVAAQLWLVENGHATIHKLAYDTHARDISPGTQLSAAMFAHVLDRDRPTLIDYGTGDDAYKADWMDRRRPLYRLELFDPKSPRGLAGAARAGVKALARRFRSNA